MTYKASAVAAPAALAASLVAASHAVRVLVDAFDLTFNCWQTRPVCHALGLNVSVIVCVTSLEMIPMFKADPWLNSFWFTTV